MVYASLGKFGKRSMQADGIRSRQVAALVQMFAANPKSSNACASVPEDIPDVAYEPNYGGLAVGPGDRDHRLRLIPKESGSEQGEASARIGVEDEQRRRPGRASRDGRQLKLIWGKYGGCTARDGFGHERSAIASRSRQRSEEEARGNGTRVASEPDNLDVDAFPCIASRQILSKQIS